MTQHQIEPGIGERKPSISRRHVLAGLAVASSAASLEAANAVYAAPSPSENPQLGSLGQQLTSTPSIKEIWRHAT